MKQSVFITRIIYGLYLILLGIFGLLLGFLLGVYRRDDNTYIFLLLLLLKILYNNGFDDVLLKYLHDLSIESNTAEQFSLKTIEKINSSPSKITLKEPDKRSQIPLPILGDPFVWIDIDFVWEESKNYKFELFKFYRNAKKK